MPISLEQKKISEYVFYEWSISKDQRIKLVEILAYLYLRQEENAQRVIDAIAPQYRIPKGRLVENVLKKLHAPDPELIAANTPGNKKEKEAAKKSAETIVWHRDGLLFQHISWIAAKMQMPKAHMTSPHVRKADKGFDCFIIEIDSDQKTINKIILCEDKASESPRSLITGSVWPEITAIVNGERDDEILADLLTLLKAVPDIDSEDAVDKIFWEESRHFRVSVATHESLRKDGSLAYVMEGFDKKVSGHIDKRVAGVLPLRDVRKQLQRLADEVSSQVREITDV